MEMSVEQRATPEQVELTEKVLQPTTDNIIAERGKVIARLHNEIAFGYTTIEAKQRCFKWRILIARTLNLKGIWRSITRTHAENGK